MQKLIYLLFHRNAKVTAFYSNYTHRWRCQICGHEWDD